MLPESVFPGCKISREIAQFVSWIYRLLERKTIERNWNVFKQGAVINQFMCKCMRKRQKQLLTQWIENAKFGRYIRRKKLTFGLYVWSAWKYCALSTARKHLITGKQSSLLRYFQKLQIIRRWREYQNDRKRVQSVAKEIIIKKAKSTFSAIYKAYLLLKEKRLASQIVQEKRKLTLQQESQKLSLASHYHRQRLLLRTWKSFRVLTSRSRNVSKELSIISDISLVSKSPLKTDQSKSMISLSRSKKSPIRGNWSFEEQDLTPSRERHERVTAIISNSFREKKETPKKESEESETDAVRKQLNLSLVESEPALAKAQEFLTQLNELLASTKKSPPFLTDL